MVAGRTEGITAIACRAVAPAAPDPATGSAHPSSPAQMAMLQNVAKGNQTERAPSWPSGALARHHELADPRPLAPVNDVIVCHCASVERDALFDAIRAG